MRNLIGGMTWTALVLLMTGWGGYGCQPADDRAAEGADETAVEATTSEGEVSGTDKPDASSLTLAETVSVFVLPAPSEIAAMVQGEEGFDLQGVMESPLPTYDGLSSERQALALGRVLADLLITVPEAPTSRVVAYLDNVEAGLAALGMEGDSIEQLRSLRSEVASGGIARAELIDRFDRVRVELLRVGKSELGEQRMALIATGGWARAVNLTSAHIERTGLVPEQADALKLRLVVATLIDRLGSDPEVRPVVDSLQAILPITAMRPSTPSSEELATLITETDEILALTRAS